jgi:hypothetical protein
MCRSNYDHGSVCQHPADDLDRGIVSTLLLFGSMSKLEINKHFQDVNPRQIKYRLKVLTDQGDVKIDMEVREKSNDDYGVGGKYTNDTHAVYWIYELTTKALKRLQENTRLLIVPK